MERVGCVVIGAGVVGLAVARALAQAGQEVLVLEQASAVGTGVSARNSEVIHAGLYYPAGSLKARLCVQGRALLYALCESHGVAHQRCGKLVVATDAQQLPALVQLASRAQANGVPIEWWDGAQARAQEPELRCEAALWSPTTGTVDSHGLLLALHADLAAAGGAVVLRTAVQSVRRGGGTWVLNIQTGGGPGAPTMALEAQHVVNAAGLHACAVAATVDGLPAAFVPTPRYAKGSYFTLSGAAPFRRLIYPAPQDAWLGVHLTLDLAGQARFGPDQEWLPGADPDALDYHVASQRAAVFYEAVRRYWPGLPDGALQPAYAGVRPKIHGPNEPAPDFRIDGPAQHGQPGLVNLLGIESPGLTSALALALEVRTRLGV